MALPEWHTPLRPARTFFFSTYNCCFYVFRQPMNCKLLADLCPCIHRSPIKLCPDIVSFACWIVPECGLITRKTKSGLGRLHSKRCLIFCRLLAKLCPNFGRSCAILCPISFAPCPFPNLAGTLHAASFIFRGIMFFLPINKSSMRPPIAQTL